ncbi:MAG: serine/threonine-protein kinase [Polyangiaceae bacterium]
MTSSEVLGRYRLLSLLGRGGMASVHLAVSEGPAGFNKLTVIKELLPELAHDPEFLGMFLDEARLAARLRHPSIVQTHDVGQEAGRFYLAMEFLDGQPLSRVTQRLADLGAPLSREHYIRVLMEVLSALDYAHHLCDYDGRPLEIVHRDVSPQNVFVTYDGQVKLVDFGIAKAVDSNTETRTGVLKGKVKYMSPEQAAGDKVDARADLFAVGVMLFEAVTGERLWAGMRNVTVVSRLLRGEIPDPREVKPELPDSLYVILKTALAPDINERYPSAGAFRSDLEAYLATRPRANLPQLGERIANAFVHERNDVQRVISSGVGSVGQLEAAAREDRTGNTPTRAAPRSSLSFNDVTSTSSVSATNPGHTSNTGLTHSHLSTTSARLLAESTDEVRSDRRSRRLLLGVVGVAAVGAGVYFGLPYLRANGVTPGVETPAAAATPVDRCSATDKPRVELTGDIEEDARLECDKDYLLKFQTVVKPGVTLTIERGTRILGDTATKATLVVQPGAKLVARGSREAPVVFTSSKPEGQRAAGDWGGLILLGNAPINLRDERGRPARGEVEGLTRGGEYGGDNPEDNSGSLEYVRIEYSGTALGPGNEINGLTLAGVGRGTLLDHIQVRHTSDDCFEFFGGTVDAKHLICQYNGDDGFDWDYGYTGRLQFLVLQQDPNVVGNTNGFEGDNDPNSSDNSPRSAPTIYNATLCGINKQASKEEFGMLLRKGTGATIRNTIVMGFDVGLDIRNANTRADIANSIFFGNISHNIAQPEKDKDADDDHGLDEERWLLDARRHVLTSDPKIAACFNPTQPVFGPAVSLVDEAADPPKDGFFDVTARYIGAFKDVQDDWATAPWTHWEVR